MDISRGVVALLAAGTAFLPACYDHHDPRQQHEDHGPEARTIQMTVWENGYEAFVEYEVPVANVPVRLITHISTTETGRPRSRGPVTFVLSGPSGEDTRHIEAGPARDGIYLPSLTFPASGEWSLVVEVPGTPATAKIHLGDIEVYASEHEALRSPAPVEVGGVSFLKEQQWKLSMRTASGSRMSMVERRQYPGRVHAQRGHRVSVASPFAGRLVVPPEVAVVDIGAKVTEGDLLAFVEPSLPSSEYLALEIKLAEAEAEALRAAQALELARSTFSRDQGLQSANAKSKREVERARYELEAASAAYTAAVAVKTRYEKVRSLVRSFRTRRDPRSGDFGPLELRAPTSGTIVKVEGSPGERVTPDMELFVILDSSVVVVEASVPEYEAAHIGTTPTAYLEFKEVDERSSRLALTLSHVGLEVDPRTHTVPFRYRAENSDGRLRVRMEVEVHLQTGKASEALAIPESSLVDEDGRYVVFVQLAGETFEKREVKLGVRDRGFVEILDGIVAGERVVTTDPWAIRLASLSTVIPAHGHEH